MSPEPSPRPTGDAPSRADLAACLAAALMLFGAGVRVLATYDPLPWWDASPLLQPYADAGLRPFGLLLLDLCVIAGAALAACVTRAASRRDLLLPWILAILGAAGVALHAAAVDGGRLAALHTGSPWVAAIFAAVGAGHLATRPGMRRVLLALAVGLIAALGAKALHQVLFEHPATLAAYEAGREQFLESRGWEPDSSLARGYERRIAQNDASAWFGLSNVYASFAAAAFVVCAGLAVPAALALLSRRADASRAPRSGLHVLCLAAVAGAALLSAAALGLTHSKGGLAAAGAGLLVLLAGPALRLLPSGAPRRNAAAALCLALPLGVLALILLRGLIGEAVGELSILFRAFYIEASARIFTDHPAIGVGPDRFRDAYMLAKNPLSPEEVTSPHSVFFDYLACLGLLGGAWVLLIGAGLWRIGRALDPTPTPSPDPTPGTPAGLFVRLLLALALLTSTLALRADAVLLTPDQLALRVVVLLLWIAFALALWRLLGAHSPRIERLVAAAAGVLLIAHAQIETTPVMPASAPLALLLFGAAVPGPAEPRPRVRAAFAAGASLAVAAALGWGILIWRSDTLAWQRRLEAAGRPINTFTQLQTRLESGRASGSLADQPARIAQEASAATGLQAPADPRALHAFLEQGKWQAAEQAVEPLTEALGIDPNHHGVRAALVRLHVDLAQRDLAAGRDPWRRLDTATALAIEGALAGGTPGGWMMLGGLHLARAEFTTSENVREAELLLALDAYEESAERNPHGLEPVQRIFEIAGRLNLPDRRRAAAERLLEIDALLRLDPLKRLTDEQRSRIEAAAAPNPAPPRADPAEAP